MGAQKCKKTQRTVRCDWEASPRLAEYETRKLRGCQIINGLVLDIGLMEVFKQESDMNRYVIQKAYLEGSIVNECDGKYLETDAN